MARACCRLMVLGCGAIGVTFVAASLLRAEGPPEGNGQHGGQRPVYQRQAFDWRNKDHDRRHDKFDRRMTPQVSGSWFQRPYPYHLDYYKMRYGGSYAPYFGNLYGTPFGTPQVVYGGWGAGGWGAEAGVYGGQPNGFQGVPYANPVMPKGTAESAAPANGAAAPPKDESLPVPVK